MGKYEVGQWVWVVNDSCCEDYNGLLGKVEAVGRKSEFPYYVRFNAALADVFTEDELAPADVRVIEGAVRWLEEGEVLVCYIGDKPFHEVMPLTELANKHVTVTIVVREGE